MKMKKIATLTLAASLMLSSCGVGNENTASGGFLGAQLGSIIGSAIGGISGGPRGSDIGTLVGMAGGAAAGAIIGNAADKANQQKYDEYKAQRRQMTQAQQQQSGSQQSYDNSSYNDGAGNDASGFDPNNGGDDVISFDGSDTLPKTSSPSAPTDACKPHSGTMMMEEAGMPALSIRNVRYVGNGMTLSSGELAKVTVEVYNNSTRSLYNVQPTVVETTGNRHIFVSAPIIIEKIAPGKGIRYTAMVKADRKLKDGTARFKVFATEKAGATRSEAEEFCVETRR